MTDLNDARRRLANSQASLVRALAQDGEPPLGFDTERVRVAASALAAKRSREAAHAWPALATDLGESYVARFADFAAETPLAREGGPLADGRAFAGWLAQRNLLGDAAAAECFRVDLRFRTTGTGLVRRRWPCFLIALLPSGAGRLIGLRIPAIGQWVFRWPWWRR